MLEELIGLGARTLLIAGATGALKPGIDVGDYVIATNAACAKKARRITTNHRIYPARADGPASLAR